MPTSYHLWHGQICAIRGAVKPKNQSRFELVFFSLFLSWPQSQYHKWGLTPSYNFVGAKKLKTFGSFRRSDRPAYMACNVGRVLSLSLNLFFPSLKTYLSKLGGWNHGPRVRGRVKTIIDSKQKNYTSVHTLTAQSTPLQENVETHRSGVDDVRAGKCSL